MPVKPSNLPAYHLTTKESLPSSSKSDFGKFNCLLHFSGGLPVIFEQSICLSASKRFEVLLPTGKIGNKALAFKITQKLQSEN